MQIYEKLLIYKSISTLNYTDFFRPLYPYKKNRILQQYFDIILIKLSTSLHCQNALNAFCKSSAKIAGN